MIKNLHIFDGNIFIWLLCIIDNHIYNIYTFISNNKEKFNDLHLIKIEKFLRVIEEDAKYVVNKIKYNNYYWF